MPLQQTFISGAESDYLSGQVFTKELVMQGAAAIGSYNETLLTRPIWTADAPAQVLAVMERHSVLGSTSGMLVKAVGSTPLGSGANALAANIAHTTAVDVYQSSAPINSTTLKNLAIGDQIGWRWSIPGNLAPTGLVTVVLQRL